MRARCFGIELRSTIEELAPRSCPGRGFSRPTVTYVKSVGHRQPTSVGRLASCAALDRLRLGVALELATSHCEFVFGRTCG
jgi:hypothetical protein